MQTSLFKRLVTVSSKLRHLALAGVAAALASPVWAALPTVPTPGPGIGGQQVASGDWLNTMGAWFKAGVTILGLVLAALGIIYVVGGALSKWRSYSKGQAEIADLKEYFIMGAVMVVFLVVMVTYAIQVFA